MISSLLHLVGLRPRVYYTLTNFRGGGGQGPLGPPSIRQCLADDCLIYRQITSNNDQIELQRDLNLLESWGVKWGMRFNAANPVFVYGRVESRTVLPIVIHVNKFKPKYAEQKLLGLH